MMASTVLCAATWALLAALALVLLAWLPLWPLLVLCALPVTAQVKRAAAASMLRAAAKGLLVLPADLLAPLVVPIALLFTPRSADKLPWLFAWWDNDVSINGDDPRYWDPAYQGTTYYANAQPRSFRARFVWLGLRNRAGRMGQMLGCRWREPHSTTAVLGLIGVNRDLEGWNIYEREGVYELNYVKRLGAACYKLHYGHKVTFPPDGRAVANVVFIGASVLPWRGPA